MFDYKTIYAMITLASTDWSLSQGRQLTEAQYKGLHTLYIGASVENVAKLQTN